MAETVKILEMHEIDILLVIEPVRLYHKGLGDEKCVNPISLGLANVVLAHDRSLDRVDDTHIESPGDEEVDKVIAVVGRRFKTNDQTSSIRLIQFGEQQTEAVIFV